jgi:acylphosphatase
MTLLIRKHLIFDGSVQNVGFRYEMGRLAHQQGVTGWVMNRVDGSVEAEVQGSPEAIAAVLRDLHAVSHIHIAHQRESDRPVIPGESAFVTRYPVH